MICAVARVCKKPFYMTKEREEDEIIFLLFRFQTNSTKRKLFESIFRSPQQSMTVLIDYYTVIDWEACFFLPVAFNELIFISLAYYISLYTSSLLVRFFWMTDLKISFLPFCRFSIEGRFFFYHVEAV